MTLNDFIKKYDGKKVEFHSFSSGALYQCVDSANTYIVEVLGLPAIIGTNAQDFPTKAGSDYEYIKNTPTGVPQAGDLMIWKSADKVGHIGIFIEGNANTFASFDQNYPTGTPSHKQSHNYTNVLGWLRAKKAPMTDNSMTIDKDTFANLVTKATKLDELEKNGYVLKKDYDERVDGLNQNVSQLTSSVKLQSSIIMDLQKQLATKPKEIIKEVPVTVIKEVIKEVPKIVEVIKEVPVEVIKVVTIDAPKVQLGGLQLLTLALKAMIAGKW